ncbi:T9SS type A sorting domain-containing protein [Flavobacterium tructae]
MEKLFYMKKPLLLLLFFLQFLTIDAQNSIDVEHEYGSYQGFSNGSVLCTATQPDGKILIGGAFSSYRGDNSSNNLIRLNPDGTKDTSFNIGAGFSNSMYSNYISSIILQDDGKMILGGVFTKFQGFPQNYIIRLNSDGSKDATFNCGTGFMDNPNGVSTVLAMVKQKDGKILVGGGFLGYQGIATKYLIRLNADGTKDTSFDIGTGFNSTVKTIVLQNDGKIIVGGEFTQFQGVSQNHLIRLNTDGSKDASFNVSSGFDATVNSIVLQPDGKIVAGGYFMRYVNDTQNGIVRLNPDGSRDKTFDILTGFGFAPSVTALGLQPDGKIIVGGAFLYYKGISQNHLIRLNSNGTKDTSFDIGTGYGIGQTDRINFIVVQQNGKIFTGGYFDDYQGITVNNILSINSDGSRDTTFETGDGFNSTVYAIAQQTDGKTIVGGKFTNYQQTLQNNLIRFNTDNSIDTSFNIGSGFFYSYNGTQGIIKSIAIQTDGKIMVGGYFNAYQGIPQKNLIRLNADGSKDNSFSTGSGFIRGYDDSDSVNSIVVQPDGKIIIGSDITEYQRVVSRYLIRLNTNGTVDTSFNIGTGFDAPVLSVALQSDGKLIVGGKFKNYQGVSQNYLVRLNADGSKDSSFNIGTGFGSLYTIGDVHSIVVQTDGKIIVGGKFSYFQGANQNYIIRLNADGSKDNSFKIGSGFGNSVLSIALPKDGKIIVGGSFYSYQGYQSVHLIRLNADGSIDTRASEFDSSSSTSVNSINLQSDGKIIIGGDFTTYRGNTNSASLIRLKGTYTPTPLTSEITPTHITCAGSTGSASIAVYGGRSPYTYLWSNGEKTSKITGLTAGDYSCTVTDADLTTVTETFKINLIPDLESPTIVAPVNISVNLSSGCTATGVLLGNPITSDNCAVDSVTNNAPTAFSIGNTIVIWTVKDSNNNTATATQIVTINDVTLPTIKAPASITVNTNTNCTATNILLGTPVTTDNCTVASVTNNAPTVFPVGNTTVTWTVKDASNNIATATQIVTVKDVTLPIITAPSNVTVNTTSNCTATGVLLGTPVTSDNCTVALVTNNAPTAFPIGNTIVTWTVTDANSNTATATQIVTVKSLNLTVTNNNGILSVAETGAIYKWLICDNGNYTVISNETNSTFKPIKNGSYAVEITKNGCTLTSTCTEVITLGTEDFETQTSLKLYPNPTQDFVTIELNSSNNNYLKIFTVNGQFILSKELKTVSTTVNISHLAAGVYMFEISNEIGKSVKKVIKR